MSERMIIGNKNVLQSYKLTMARYNFSVTEKRILYRLVEIASCYIENTKPNFRKGCFKYAVSDLIAPYVSNTNINGCDLKIGMGQNITIRMNMRNILPTDYTNYTEASKAFDKLASRKIEYEDNNTWYIYNFLSWVKIEKGSGTVEFCISNDVWALILDFSKGYRKYELLTAFNLRSIYSMRLYELVSHNKREICISIPELRKMFCLENKYKNVNDLLKRTLDVAKNELEEKCPYTFNYEAKKGKYGKIEAVIIIPVYISENNDTNVIRKTLESKLDISHDISDELRRFLTYQCNFKPSELKQHRQLWIDVALKIPIPKLRDLWIKSTDNNITNTKGYFIASVRNLLNQTDI